MTLVEVLQRRKLALAIAADLGWRVGESRQALRELLARSPGA